MNILAESPISHGDILLTRNPLRSNPTPGYWNHAAIVFGPKDAPPERLGVAEVQSAFREVTAFRLPSFIRRYPQIKAIRYEWNQGSQAAQTAQKSIGTPIRFALIAVGRFRLSPKIGGRENCVSFIRKCFYSIDNIDRAWIIPDDLDADMAFMPIWEHDNDHWTPPADKWSGRIERKMR